MRFTIGGLLGAVVFCGVGVAALRRPSALWANFIDMAAVIALMTAAVNVAFARGDRRRFWGGFAICGGSYFAMCVLPPFRDDLAMRLATTPFLEMLYERTAPKAEPDGSPAWQRSYVTDAGRPTYLGPPPSVWEAWTIDYGERTGVRVRTAGFRSTLSYRRIGHALFALLFGLVGGALTRRAFREPETPPA